MSMMYFKPTGHVITKTYVFRRPDFKNPTEEDLVTDRILPPREHLGTIITSTERKEVFKT